jgi:transposase
MGAILMSCKERRRLELLARVRDKMLKLVKAAELMPLSYRQAKRMWQRFKQEGAAGLVHRLRGRRSVRAKPLAKRKAMLERYRERYGDFGPTLAAEYLVQEGYSIDHETLRRWLIQEGLWQSRRKRQKHRQWRERKAHLGELVQMDGSHHDWFEGRRDPAVLMVMIDDATSRTYARFFEQETTFGAMETFARYSRRYGLPQALYVDLDSIYRTDREPTVREQLRDETPVTQFGRAMRNLEVEIVLAYSPQAKGRVERRNGVFQDRLVKALRLAGINDLNAANEFLERKFLGELNRRFNVVAAVPGDLHRPLAHECKLDDVLSVEEKRVVAADWTLSWHHRYFQLCRQKGELGLVGKPIIVRHHRDGRLQLLYGGKTLRWTELPSRPKPAKEPPRAIRQVRPNVTPAGNHPWRSFGVARGKSFCREWARGQRPFDRGISARPPPPSTPHRGKAGGRKQQQPEADRSVVTTDR